ncbi:DNA internalization-related competence protein ComEC/Rec2 [Desulfosarcina sp. OttesenSCG-928-G10]|nr:DNA internalization-related competence protein ComEC/Rec2 [Desulfosarcina sp. OttesenSCG-928-G10]MDL2321297.1 DNA internalization-related competence protein ComEC/Rec2 [Desulfosarcina sp. OttesenSCG-928-B08]
MRTAFSFSRPAIVVALSLIIGILLGAGLSGYNGSAWIVAGIALASMAFCRIRGKGAGLSALAALVATGYLSISPWLLQDRGPDHVSHYLDSGYWWMEGAVTTVEPDSLPDRSRVVMAVETLSRKDLTHRVSGRIRVSITGNPQLVPGDRIRFFSQIRSFRNFRNPGGFDYRRYMAFQGICGSAWISRERLQIRKPEASFQYQWVHRVRARLGRLMDEAGKNADPDAVAVLKALVYGDPSGIHPELRDRFNRAGVGHVLSISGLHVGIVATVAFAGFRWLLAWVPPLLWRGWGRAGAAVATLFPVAGYGLLAGMTPPTLRSVIMVSVFLLSLLMGRRHDTLNALAVAALIILLMFPPALFSISFQLSFSAVLAIVYGMGKLGSALDPEQKPSFSRKMRDWLKNSVLVSVLAIFGTLPLTLMHFNETSLVGVAANLLVVPLAGFIAIPVGLVSAVLSAGSDAVSIWGFRLALGILEWVLGGMDGLAGLSFASVKTVTPSLPETVLYLIGCWALLNFRHHRYAIRVLAVVLVLGLADGGYWIWKRFFDPDLRVTAIDVGQGTAALIELPGGRVMMADGGGFPDNVRFDVGKQVIAPLLWRKKIATVDILMFSHPDSDHLNGLVYLARHFHVRELWTTDDTATTPGYQALMTACAEKGIRIQRMSTDTEKMEINGVSFEIFNPAPDFFKIPVKNPGGNRNSGSLVVKAAFGETSFLFTGDILVPAERAMVRRNKPGGLAATVLFVPHHGSRTSSSPELVTAVSPAVAVVCAGRDNPFGFPNPDVVARYHRAGSRVVCTCTHGAITLRSNGKAISLVSVTHPLSDRQR